MRREALVREGRTEDGGTAPHWRYGGGASAEWGRGVKCGLEREGR